MKNYLYKLLTKYLSLYILPQNSVLEIDPSTTSLISAFPQGKITLRESRNGASQNTLNKEDLKKISEKRIDFSEIKSLNPNYIILCGLLHYENDIQELFSKLHQVSNDSTRLILLYYSNLWRPFIAFASMIGIRSKNKEQNWLAHEDIANLLALEKFELISLNQKILIPIYIPFLSNFVNRYIAPLPFIKNFCLVNIAVAKRIKDHKSSSSQSVSIVVPARNEAGNIKEIINRIPKMGPEDEIIFIEGNSTDDTWSVIKKIKEEYGDTRNIVIAQQEGKGKGDAVRLGFSLATKDIFMILDADMTVPPEDLPKFYREIVFGSADFVNGNRLVYPMEKGAMRFFNLIGNKFFALSFSFVLSQRFKDTLCGTKVITSENYKTLAKNRSFFGNFDPFGDFDLIFGASRMGLKIIEVPITYRERTYGDTNISRWRHGTILLAMLIYAARKIKFI